VQLTAVLEAAGETATGLEVPPEVPDDLAAALAGTPGASEAFAALSYSHQRRHVLAVDGAKAPETRARRVGAVVTAVAP
jgi:uncharacterized protein YdeI (YjbR/CyaY-like superfamily)